MDDGSLERYGTHQDASQKGGNSRSPIAADGGSAEPSLTGSLPQMMFGFGDDENPLPETVACMQQLVCEYIRHVTDEACKAAEVKGKLDTECFVFAVRGDMSKFKRVRELLDLNVHIKNCTRQRFTDQEMPVFHPSFLPTPKARAVASISSLASPCPSPLSNTNTTSGNENPR